MALELPSGADCGSNRHCKTNPVDLEGSRGQVLVVLGGFWKVLRGEFAQSAGVLRGLHNSRLSRAIKHAQVPVPPGRPKLKLPFYKGFGGVGLAVIWGINTPPIRTLLKP
jgi:hypothetical protein